MLPEYCASTPSYEDRTINVGFIGGLHPRRRKLFDALDDLGIPVNVMSGGLSYRDFLQSLSSIRIFVNNQDDEFTVNGKSLNMRDTMWVRDVEAAARGCFVIRNRGKEHDTYLEGIQTVFQYESFEEIPSIISDIEKMDPAKRQSLVDNTVKFIQTADRWHETATQLVDLATTERIG